MLGDLCCGQVGQEVFDLLNRDREANPNVDTATLCKSRTAVDADDFASHVHQRATGVARIDRTIDLDAVPIHHAAALVAFNAADDPHRDGGLVVFRKHKRVPHRHCVITDSHRIRITEPCNRPNFFAEQLNHRDVASRVGADELPVVELSIAQSSLAFRSGGSHDMVIGQREPGFVKQHARATAFFLAVFDLTEDRNDGSVNAFNRLGAF